MSTKKVMAILFAGCPTARDLEARRQAWRLIERGELADDANAVEEYLLGLGVHATIIAEGEMMPDFRLWW